MNLRMAIIPVLAMLLLVGALAAACSSDDDADTGDSDPTATAIEPADDGDADGDGDDDGNSGGASGSGNATLTIGDESWSFDDIFCAFSPEESRNDRVSFTLSAFGETVEGVRMQLDATIQDPDEQGRYEGEGVIHSVSLDDVEDFENPTVSWTALTGFFSVSDSPIQVDGKNVTAEATFDDGRTDDTIEEVAGNLVATCP